MDSVEPADPAPAPGSCEVRHPHLVSVAPTAVVDHAPGAIDEMPGTRLDELASQIGPFSEEEVATVVVPVAQALGALHGAGLVHGAVDERCVVVRPDGMPVLLDPSSAPGDAERRRADLYALIGCAVGLLPDATVYAAAGLGPDCLRAELLALLDRPELDAGELVDACFRQVEPAPLRRPRPSSGAGTGPDTPGASGSGDGPQTGRPAADGGQGDLAGMAAGLLRSAAAGGQRPGSARGGHHRAGHHRAGPARRSQARGRRDPRMRRGPAAHPRLLVGAAVLLVLGLTLVGVRHLLVDAPAQARSQASAGGVPGDAAGAGTQPDPAAAAADLSRRRAELLADPVTADLGSVEVVDGPAYLADSAVLASMDGVRNTGLETQVQSASTVSIGADGTARVRVTAAQSGYLRTAADGATSSVPGSDPRTVELELRWTDDGWRVWSVSEPVTP
ncbi:MAG: hypothetical protein L6367_08660 [Cellulomonas sp.]|nr:hypothetical protein [Cellulomonas sp.]